MIKRDKERRVHAHEIMACIVIVMLCVMFVADYAKAQGIPNTQCEWHCIDGYIYTECGHCISDGCPYCARNICVNTENKEEMN